nr:MerR family transcriptional regulator [uncultured Cetobacterium sp.]
MKFYKISEVAKIFNISRETLIYYDSIDLFKPCFVDEENGYRFYNDENISDLYFISMLKKSNFSLSEIKKYMNCKNSIESLSLLNDKLSHIKKQISVLENSAKFISEKIEEIEQISSPDGCLPFIENLDELPVYVLDINEPKREKELVEGIGYLNNFRKKNGLEKCKRVTILKKEDVDKENFFRIDKIGVIVEKDSPHKNLTLKKGKFVSIYHKDSTQKIGESYLILKKYIQENNLILLGDSQERFKDVIVNAGNCMGQTIKISLPISF